MTSVTGTPSATKATSTAGMSGSTGRTGTGEHGQPGSTARGDIACGNGRASSARDIPGSSELWLYLRGSGEQRELVCKVFDAYPGWVRGGAPGLGGRRAPADSMSGRGLEVVHEMSHGRWGYHLTRARLGGWSLRGKAVWFATPAPQALAGSSARSVASPLLVSRAGRAGPGRAADPGRCRDDPAGGGAGGPRLRRDDGARRRAGEGHGGASRLR